MTDGGTADGRLTGGAAAGGAAAGTAPAEDDLAGAGATVLVLLRHGESTVTAQKRFSGSGVPSVGAGAAGGVGGPDASGGGAWGGARGGDRVDPDPELSERGRWQAARAARELAVRGGVHAVVSSPLARCRRTADQAAALLGLDVTVEPALRETDFGAWEGLTPAEARERYPAETAAWYASPSAAPPGGESFDDVARRVIACRDALLAAMPGRTVLVVSHVTPIKTLARLALGAPAESLFRMDLAPASLTEIAHYPDGNASLRHLNATAHLR